MHITRSTTRAVALLGVVTLGVMSCAADEYTPRVICHNANCVEPASVADDDTPEALAASLALVAEDNSPLIDGVEIDTFWYGAESRCLFAHDLDNLDKSSAPEVATDLITEHLEARIRDGERITRSAPEFSVFVELKGHVGASKAEKHTEAQRAQHADCAVSIAERFASSASASGYEMEVIFTSFDSELLSELSQHEGYRTLRDGVAITARLGALAGVPAPLDSQTEPVDNFDEAIGVDFASVHPHWTRHATIRAYESRGWSLGLWMFSIVPETLDAIEVYEPDYVTTSEARAFTRWLDR